MCFAPLFLVRRLTAIVREYQRRYMRINESVVEVKKCVCFITVVEGPFDIKLNFEK